MSTVVNKKICYSLGEDLIMSTTVICECCGKHGEKHFRHPAPRGWLYMESVETDLETCEPVEPIEEHTMVLFVCSKECAMGVWKSVPALPEPAPCGSREGPLPSGNPSSGG
jgi:hypothetical protein